MKRVVSTLLLLSTVWLSSCQPPTYIFAIENRSGAPLEIRYTVDREISRNARARDALEPATMPVSEFEDTSNNWHRLSEDQYVFDRETRSVTVTLAPGEALRVITLRPYFGPDEGRDFGILNIRLSGANGTIEYAGRQAETQFKPTKRSWFFSGDPTYSIQYQ